MLQSLGQDLFHATGNCFDTNGIATTNNMMGQKQPI